LENRLVPAVSSRKEISQRSELHGTLNGDKTFAVMIRIDKGKLRKLVI
jgi:hypothetical protein